MSHITIINAHLIRLPKGVIKVKMKYQESLGSESLPTTHNDTNPNQPKQTLVNSFEALNIHAALLNEFVAVTSIPDIKKPNAKLAGIYKVTGFKLEDIDSDKEGVILIATKELKSGELFGFETKKAAWLDKTANAYKHLALLKTLVDDCVDLLVEYIGGDYEPNPQGKLFDAHDLGDPDNN